MCAHHRKFVSLRYGSGCRPIEERAMALHMAKHIKSAEYYSALLMQFAYSTLLGASPCSQEFPSPRSVHSEILSDLCISGGYVVAKTNGLDFLVWANGTSLWFICNRTGFGCGHC